MMTFQRCAIVVGILCCYSFSSLEAIDCETKVFHPKCRGVQTKRSSFQTDEANYPSADALRDLFGLSESSGDSAYPSRLRDIVNNNYEAKSNLRNALLKRGLNPEAMYDWYLAYLQEKNADLKRKNWIQDNYQGKNFIDGDY